MRTKGRTDRQRNITKLIVAFRSSANAPKNESFNALCWWSLWEYQFSCTASRRFQNHILLRPRNEQLALKPAEGYVRFSRRLLFMLENSSVKTTKPRRPGMRPQIHTCFHSYPTTCLAYQVPLTCHLRFL